MINVINVALKRTTSVILNGIEYELNDAAIKLCKKLYTFYILLLGITVAVSFNIAPLVGSQTLFTDILFVIVCLLVYNLIMDFIFNKILTGKVNKK